MERSAFLPLTLLLAWTTPKAESPVESSAKEWTKLQGCTLLANPSNDGDSFHVRHDGKEYIFRLYFVDAPETETRFPDRVKAQRKMLRWRRRSLVSPQRKLLEC